MSTARCAFYVCIGRDLFAYAIDTAEKSLREIGRLTMPASVQYAWQHPSLPLLYVGSSSGYVSSKEPGAERIFGAHYLSTLRIDPVDGCPSAIGAPVMLPSRPVHLTLDRMGQYVLVAHPNPVAITIRHLHADGTVGAEIPQADDLDLGIYPHQVTVTPSNRHVIVTARGHNPRAGHPEEPGALKVLSFSGGVLRSHASVAPNGGYGYGPRHVAYHPSRPWMYVSFEKQNEMHMHELTDDGISPGALHVVSTLTDRRNTRFKQGAGPIHVHPSGRLVYVANRSSSNPQVDGQRVFAGGEDNVVVYALDPVTGAPRFVQAADAHGFHPRTFGIDPGGTMLLSSAQFALRVSTDPSVPPVAGGVSTFDIGSDGRLEFVRKYPMDTSQHTLWWSGVVRLPEA